MKFLKNKKGVTLIELMISVGLAGGLALIIMNTFKQSKNAQFDLQKTSEVNNLIFKITTELSRKQTCEKNFKGLAVPTSPATLSLAALTSKNGTSIITKGQPYGESILNIVDIKYSGVAGGTNTKLIKMNLNVSYQTRQRFGQVAIPVRNFNIPINVYNSERPPIKVLSCNSEADSLLINAVANACVGNAAKYTYVANDATYPYGHCEHEIEVKQMNGTNTPTAYICPAGQFLRILDTTQNKLTFKCETVSAVGAGPVTPSCPAYQYLIGIKADGSADCKDIRLLFSGIGVLVYRGGTYVGQAITCPAGKILQKIDMVGCAATGGACCVDPTRTYTCPIGQYIDSIDAAGNPHCSFDSNHNSCVGSYMSAIDNQGNVTCTPAQLNGNCLGNNVITSVNAAGNVGCSVNQP